MWGEEELFTDWIGDARDGNVVCCDRWPALVSDGKGCSGLVLVMWVWLH